MMRTMRTLALVLFVALAGAACSVQTFEDGSAIIDTGSLVVIVPAFDSPGDQITIHEKAQRLADELTSAGVQEVMR